MEKANNPMLTVSPALKNDLNISNAQVLKLDALSREDIHELSFVKNLQIKSYLLLNDVTPKEKETFLKIALIEEIAGIGKNYDGNCFKSISSIANMPPTLKAKLNALPANQKKIAECYLNLHRDKNDKVSPSKLAKFEKDLPGSTVFATIEEEVVTYRNNTVAKENENEKKNAIIDYAKKLAKIPGALWDHFFAKTYEAEKINLSNNAIKDEFEKINTKHGFTKAEEMNDVYFTVASKTKKAKANITSNMMAIRTKALAATTSVVHKINSLLP